jgi:hypothetical protein
MSSKRSIYAYTKCVYTVGYSLAWGFFTKFCHNWCSPRGAPGKIVAAPAQYGYRWPWSWPGIAPYRMNATPPGVPSLQQAELDFRKWLAHGRARITKPTGIYQRDAGGTKKLLEVSLASILVGEVLVPLRVLGLRSISCKGHLGQYVYGNQFRVN